MIQTGGPHFTAKVLHQVAEALGIMWKFHTPWRPQSSGRVEQINQTFKVTLTKLIEESKMKWLECLPLALMRIRTKLRADIGISPYKMMFGLPFLITSDRVGSYKEGEQSTKKYIKTIISIFEKIRKTIPSPKHPIDFKIHSFQPGDWVLMKLWKEQPLSNGQ